MKSADNSFDKHRGARILHGATAGFRKSQCFLAVFCQHLVRGRDLEKPQLVKIIGQFLSFAVS